MFSDVPDDVLEHLLHPVEHLLVGSKGILYHEGDAARHVYSIRDGLVKLVQLTPNGSKRIVRLLRAGDALGLEALGGGGSYRHTAEAILATDLCRIPIETLSGINARHYELYEALVQHWQTSIDMADEVITRFSTGTAQGRLARFLLHPLAEPEGESCLALSRDELAALLGLTIETVSRTVAEFKRKGIVEEKGGRFRFDRSRLEPMAML